MNLDFRGRVYPIPPHLNHLGNDLCRGLLSFARKKPLGERGLFWLKIQVANLYGNDKVGVRSSFHEDLFRRSQPVGRRAPPRDSRVRAKPPRAERVVEGGRRSLAASGHVHGVHSRHRLAAPRGLLQQHPRASSPPRRCAVSDRTGAATACSTTPRWDSTKPAERRSIWCPARSPAMCTPQCCA